MVIATPPLLRKPCIGTLKVGQDIGTQAGRTVQSEVGKQVIIVVPLGDNWKPAAQLHRTTEFVKPLVNEELKLLRNPLLGAFNVGHGKGAHVGIVVHRKFGSQVAVVVSFGERTNPAAQLN